MQSDSLSYSPYISSYAGVAKNKMAAQTQEFCEAEERKIFASKKMIVQEKLLKQI
jgi:hypothetical protein